MNQIYIKAWYGNWTPVSKEHAEQFCRHLISGMVCPNADKRRIIEGRHLKGATLAEIVSS